LPEGLAAAAAAAWRCNAAGMREIEIDKAATMQLDMRLLRCAASADGTDAINSVAEMGGVRVTIWKNIW